MDANSDDLISHRVDVNISVEDSAETELSVYNVNKFTYETVVPELPEGIREHATTEQIHDPHGTTIERLLDTTP